MLGFRGWVGGISLLKFGRRKLQNSVFQGKDQNIPLNWEEWQTGNPVTKDSEIILVMLFRAHIKRENKKWS